MHRFYISLNENDLYGAISKEWAKSDYADMGLSIEKVTRQWEAPYQQWFVDNKVKGTITLDRNHRGRFVIDIPEDAGAILFKLVFSEVIDV